MNVYDIIENITFEVDLDLPFRISKFSKSIILPTAKIFIIGGEYFSRKEVFVYDHVLRDFKFIRKQPMTQEKYDFTLCHLKNFIYVFCGKNSISEVTNTCEKYNINQNSWQSIANVSKKRYAACAIGCANNRIYLFGGRSDKNGLVVEIEEYIVTQNQW